MFGFEINDDQIIWIYQFTSYNDELDKIIKIVEEPQMDSPFVGIIDEKDTYLLCQLYMFLDKHCKGDVVEKFIYLEDIM
jgi:hypothetical protein